jgi:hypothetical protein
MRPQRQQTFRLDAASRLDDIELIAALLERDATNNRVHVAERGAPLLPIKRRRPSRMVASRRLALRGAGYARRVALGLMRLTQHPRLYVLARTVCGFCVDFAVVLAAVAAAVLVVTGAFLIGAPPV